MISLFLRGSKIYGVMITLLLVLGSTSLFAQSDKASVKLKAKATRQSIKLRWAVNSPAAWHFANQYGYTIERVTLTENGQVLDEPKRIILNEVPLKPAAQEFWEGPMDDDDYVAVAAQAIFGETFEMTEDYSSDIMKVVNKARELESRFSFALFSADQSLKAAQLSGLYFEDETIAQHSKYLYRVYTNIPQHILEVDTAFVYIGLQDYKPLPKPVEVNAKFDDHMALISWNGALFEKVYNSFWVERSEDGKTFKKITEKPITNSYAGDKPASKLMFRVDSLPSNDQEYYYRVIGINAFGETSPPSDTVSGFGRPIFAYSAAISEHEITEEGQVRLQWSFPENGKSLLKSFDLLRVDQATKEEEVVQTNIDPFARAAVDKKPYTTNYYVVRAVDRYGRKNNSFPYLVQLEDSIPPAAPTGLIGRIDTLGRVHLSWAANTEKDLEGYKVFKSNFQSEQFIQVPGPILQTNSYVDTIKLNNLTEKIYYKVRAMDRRYNPSEFSVEVALEKPDLIPPVPPVFSEIKGDSLGVRISWQTSGSEDVARHMLYRKADNEQQWTLIKVVELTDTSKTYLDKTVKHRVTYAYTMLAVDDDLLESVPAVPLSIKWISSDPYPRVEQIFYKVKKEEKSVNISWVYNQKDVEKYLIYKAVNGQPVKLFKTVESDQTSLDDQLKVNDTSIEYRIVASFKSGERTRASKALIIKI